MSHEPPDPFKDEDIDQMIDEIMKTIPRRTASGFAVTKQQRIHLIRLQTQFQLLSQRKYIKGAEEHGGFLGDNHPLKLLDMAIEEAIDQYIYLVTLRDQLVKRGLVP